jgi:TatD DNase family protein
MTNKLSYIDSHAHLAFFSSEELDQILQRARNAHVERIINVCLNPEALEQGLVLQKKYPWIYCAAATSPHDAATGEKLFSYFAAAAREKKIVALGETGLDYHYHTATKELQTELLIQYFQCARSSQLPIILHCREAFPDLFDIAAKEFPSTRVLLHCFSGTKKEAKEALDRGWMISFSGIVSFKKSHLLREVASYVPLENMMIETDAPYLAPEAYRGKKNEPSYLPAIAQAIADSRKISLEEIATRTRENATLFFSLESK